MQPTTPEEVDEDNVSITSWNNNNNNRKRIISRYLFLTEEEQDAFPVLTEYLGVALAFTALGTLIRRVNDRNSIKGPAQEQKLERAALDSLLKRAMKRLQGIALKTQQLEERVEICNKLASESRVAEENEAEHTEVMDRSRRVECELEDATDNISRAKLEALDIEESRKEVEACNAKLVAELNRLKGELRDQEQVLTTVVKRVEILKAENSELAKQLDETNDGDRIIKQAVQQREVHAVYMDQIAELENQVGYYQKRIEQLEEFILNNFGSEGDKRSITGEDFELETMKNLLRQYVDAEHSRELELGKWRKLYTATKIAFNMAQSGNSYPDAGTTELAERHWCEVSAFERHMKAKDERMEALRTHLLSLEKQVKTKDVELTELRQLLDSEASTQTNQKLEGLTGSSNTNKKRSRNLDANMRDAERHGKDLKLKLALLEAKLVQTQMQYEKEKRSRENFIIEVLKEKQMLENMLKESVRGNQSYSIKTAIDAAQLEVEKLSDKIAEASEHILEAREHILHTDNEYDLQSIVQQAGEVSNSGKVLKKLHSLITVENDNSESYESERNDHLVINSASEREEMRLALDGKKQLQLYQFFLQKINDLCEQCETASNVHSLNPLLQRALELQSQVRTAGCKLPSVQKHGGDALKEHLSQIQKRLDLKSTDNAQGWSGSLQLVNADAKSSSAGNR